MAGQIDRSSAGQTGRGVRRPAAGGSEPSCAASDREPVGIEVGPDARPLQGRSDVAAAPSAAETLPRLIKTEPAYRRLIQSGITGPEAASLISYVIGLAPCETRWSLAQVNRLLFLRNLYHDTDWGHSEQRSA